MTQAKRGGEYGVNGEFYQGGEFLPSSPNTIKGEFTRQQVKAQKKQASQEIIAINEKINAFVTESFPGKSPAQARELYAKYLSDNGVNTHRMNIYGKELGEWI